MVRSKHGYPAKQGLYSPEFEKEACGVGFVAKINGEKSHQVFNIYIYIYTVVSVICYVYTRTCSEKRLFSFHLERMKM